MKALSLVLAAMLRAVKSAWGLVSAAIISFFLRFAKQPKRDEPTPAEATTQPTASSSPAVAAAPLMTNEASPQVRVRVRGPIVQLRRRTPAFPYSIAFRPVGPSPPLTPIPRRAPPGSIPSIVVTAYLRSVLSPMDPSIEATTAPLGEVPFLLHFHGEARSPWLPLSAPAFADELLLPPTSRHSILLAQGAAARDYAPDAPLQRRVALLRMLSAHHYRQRAPPPQDPVSYDCGCGWCPDGVAAYELCAAVTIHRTMRSFARPSAASTVWHRFRSVGASATSVPGRARQ